MRIEPAVALAGHIAVPGNKSISHRAVLLGAVAEGETLIRGFGRSEDTESTIAAVRALGVPSTRTTSTRFGSRGRPARPAGGGRADRLRQLGDDAAPTRRPARRPERELRADRRRLAATPSDGPNRRPARRDGRRVQTEDGKPPLRIEGGRPTAISYELPVASAQVKSAILLAGLYAEGRTTVIEPVPTRDHTEIMLAAAGAPIQRRPGGGSGRSRRALDGWTRSRSRATSPPRRRSSSRRRCCRARR